MTPSDHERMLDILGEALELPPEQRGAYLDSSCINNPELRAQVEHLLAVEHSAADAIPTKHGQEVFLSQALQAPTQIGPYKIIRELGHGGMGVVYLAEQQSPLRRSVAVKVLLPGLESRRQLARFEAERQTLALMSHPNVAQVYDAGITELGRPYLVMEYVDGQPITEYCETHRLTTNERIELFLQVCDALQHAHQRAIIHRDLKPSNLLVMRREGKAIPKIIDFGIAKFVQPFAGASLLTEAAQIVGTLSYMSPERLDATDSPDIRSDVFSLGVILYELLSGVLPIDLRGQGLVTAARRICEEEPRRLGAVNRSFRGDIEAVVAGAMEKDLSRRYASVEAFAAELKRVLDGRPIEVRRSSRLYVLRKTAWRHRQILTVAAISICLLCAFAVYSWLLARSNHQKSEALRRLLYVSNVGFAHAALVNNDVPRVNQLLGACPPDLRGWEWNYLDALADQSVQSLPLEANGPRYAFRSADRSKILIASLNLEVLLVDASSGATLFRRVLDGGTARAAIAPDGNTIAFGGYAHQLAVVDVQSGRERSFRTDPPDGASQFAQRARAIYFSPDGTRLAAVNLFGRVWVWDVATGQIASQFSVGPREPQCMLFTADGASLLIGNDAGTVRRFDPGSGTMLQNYAGHNASISCMELSADGSKFVTGDFAGYVYLWSLNSGDPLAQFRMENQWITTVGLSPDEKTLAIGRADAGLFIFDVANRFPLAQLRGHQRGVIRAWYSGDRITSVGLDSRLRSWIADPSLNTPVINTGQRQSLGVIFMPDGGSFFNAGTGGKIRRWDTHTLAQLQVYEGHTETSYAVGLDRSGRRLVSGGRDKTLRLWDVPSGRLLRSISVERGHVLSSAISPDGTRLLSGDVEGGIQLWDADSGQLLKTWTTSGRTIYSLAFHPDGRHFVSGGGDGLVRVWDSDADQPVAAVQVDPKLVYEVRLSRDGRQFAAVGDSGAAKLFDLSNLAMPREIWSFAGHVGSVVGVAVHPDGSRVATCGADRTIRIWDTETGTELLTLRGHSNLIQRLAFSPDGKTLASTSDDGTVRLWRAGPP